MAHVLRGMRHTCAGDPAMKPTWYKYRQKAEDARIQEEIRTAKKIQKERSDITWTEALRLARVLLDPIPVL